MGAITTSGNTRAIQAANLLDRIRKLKNDYKEREEYLVIEQISDLAVILNADGQVARNRFQRTTDNVELEALTELEFPKDLWFKSSNVDNNIEKKMRKIESESDVKFESYYANDYPVLFGSISFPYVRGWDDLLIGKSIPAEDEAEEDGWIDGPFFSHLFDKYEEHDSTMFPENKDEFERSRGITAKFDMYYRKDGHLLHGLTLLIYEPTLKAVKQRRKSGDHFIEGSTRMMINSESQYQMLKVVDMLLTHDLNRVS